MFTVITYETRDIAHHLRLKLHFGGDVLGLEKNVYPLQGFQCQEEWKIIAKSLLGRQGINEFEFALNPERIRFNWLSDLVQFAETIQGEVEERIVKRPSPDARTRIDLAAYDLSAMKPN